MICPLGGVTPPVAGRRRGCRWNWAELDRFARAVVARPGYRRQPRRSVETWTSACMGRRCGTVSVTATNSSARRHGHPSYPAAWPTRLHSLLAGTNPQDVPTSGSTAKDMESHRPPSHHDAGAGHRVLSGHLSRTHPTPGGDRGDLLDSTLLMVCLPRSDPWNLTRGLEEPGPRPAPALSRRGSTPLCRTRLRIPPVFLF